MRRSALLAAFAVIAAASPVTAQAKAPPSNWDGLVQVPSKQLKYVYLQPGADFRGYTKVIIEPTEVAFHKDWRKDYNSTRRDLAGRVSESDVQQAVKQGIGAATDIFTTEWQNSGYAIATAPGPDVLTVRTGVLNISVTAPDQQVGRRSFAFANEAGFATLFVEVRDSQSGALLGRAVDQEIAGDNSTGWRTSVSNRGDFRSLVSEWAKLSVKGMAQLKALSPIAP